jgi:glucosylceramidase
MKKTYFLSICFIFVTLTLNIVFAGGKVDKTVWISTTSSNQWNERLGVAVLPVEGNIDIEIFPDKKAQQMDGFGGCFNEKGWEALNWITPEKRNKILDDLFNQTTGCRFSICRMPIGASDYAIKWYSLNETPGDYAMTNFSLSRDKQYLIPYIKAAQTIYPNLRIWASPWSPPTWMKRNNNYASKSSKYNKEYNSGIEGKEGQNLFIMNDSTLSAYALYFSKFCKEYKKEGIDILSVHVQNEFHSGQIFPSCPWTAGGLATFIGKYLGPRFEKDNISSEIWFGTMERPYVAEIDTILNDPYSKKYVKGVGFQWGGKPAVLEVHSRYKDLRLMQTESECGDGSNDWKAAEKTWNLMKSYIGNGVNSYIYWNMVLEESGVSTWGWKQNALITINSKNKNVKYTPEFYLMKHFSHFVENGAYRIQISKVGEDILAFQNPNGQIVIVIYNNKDSDQVMRIKIGDKMITPKLSSKSFNTFAINI